MEQALQALSLGVESIASSTMHIWVKKVCIVLHLGQTYLMFCCSSLAGQNFFVSKKKKEEIDHDWFNVHIHVAAMALLQMARLWLSVKVVSGYTGAIRVQNYWLFPGGNSWHFIVKDQSESQVFTGHPGLLCDWASLSKTLSGSGLKRGFALDLANVASLTSYTMFTAHLSFG